MEKGHQDLLKRSYSHAGFGYKRRLQKGSLIWIIKRVFSRTFGPNHVSSVAPVKNMGNLGHLGGLKDHEWVGNERVNELTISSVGLSSEGSFVIDDDNDQCLSQSQNLQWAPGKAGEDRVHVVVSEEHGWVFVGIYDGFNGPAAPDFLLSNMYQAVF
ncbi:Protein phosphatase 2C [Artemisia annua]|uniref:Protein phosphatase 2C n=1 Tax=Artemisia annua TaxID=35608 RepID=A0A2U1KWQ8_ARTAN|nr:Protein phosphatase 2C [Artemisia annua]PWA82319.1 Protein phosphatase 2C [Artemisia annua]